MFSRLLIVLCCFGISLSGYTQTTGFVYDAETLTPLPGATIIGSEFNTITNINGEFTLPQNPPGLIIISHLGYVTDTLQPTKTGNEIRIFLRPDYTQLEQIIVRGPLLPTRLLTLPSSAAIMHQTSLISSVAGSYVEHLNQVSGVYAHSGSLNTSRITVRGIGSRTPYATNRIKAYFNDIPLTTGDGTTVIEDIDPSMINTLEIIKGSKSAFYGSGLGGIIIISGRDYFEPGLKSHAALNTGSYGSINPQFGLQYSKGRFSVSTAYSYVKSDGWRQNSNYNRQSLNLQASYRSKKIKTSFLFHYISLKAFIPSSLSEEDFMNTPESAAQNWLNVNGFEEYYRLLYGVKNIYTISEKLSNTTIFYGNISNGYESRPFNILDDNSFQVGLKTYMTYTPGRFRLRSGLDVQWEKYNWTIYETNLGTRGVALNKFYEIRKPNNIFLQADYTFDSGGLIEVGVSYNFLSYDLNDQAIDTVDLSGNYKYTPVFSPFIGIYYPVGKYFHLYSSAGHGFSTPSVEETLLPAGQINPQLKPESGINLELGIRTSAFEGNLFADINYYLMFIDNLLVTERLTEDIFYGKNAGSTTHNGIEFNGIMRLNNHQQYNLPQTRINIAATFSKIKFTDFIDDGIDLSGNYLPGVPATNFFTDITFKYRMGFYASMQFQYTGKQYLDDANELAYEPHHLANLKIGYTPTLKNKITINFYAGIKNLLDQHYASMLLVNAPSFGGSAPRYYYPGQPRNFYAGLSVSF